jgi:uncharacterized membrane protein YidH (DUF202 family)
MTKNDTKESLKEIITAKSFLNPDNHDQVNATIAMSNSESAENIKKTLDELGGRLSGSAYTLGTIMEQQTKRTIDSNKKLSQSNTVLTIALILTTLFVGIMQAFVIWKTSGK